MAYKADPLDLLVCWGSAVWSGIAWSCSWGCSIWQLVWVGLHSPGWPGSQLWLSLGLCPDGLSSLRRLRLLTTWIRAERGGSPHGGGAAQLSACIVFTNVPLAKASPVAEPASGQRKRLHPYNKRRGKVTLQIDKHTAVRRLCGHESNQPHSLMLLG